MNRKDWLQRLFTLINIEQPVLITTFLVMFSIDWFRDEKKARLRVKKEYKEGRPVVENQVGHLAIRVDNRFVSKIFSTLSERNDTYASVRIISNGIKVGVLLDIDIPVVIIKKDRLSRRLCSGQAVRLEHGFVQETVLGEHTGWDVELPTAP